MNITQTGASVSLVPLLLVNDSTALIQPDSTVVARLNQLDSLRQETEADYSNFKNQYDSINRSASATQSKLQSKIDSLTTLNLPTLNLSHKLDSKKEARASKLKELENKWQNTNPFRQVLIIPKHWYNSIAQ